MTTTTETTTTTTLRAAATEASTTHTQCAMLRPGMPRCRSLSRQLALLPHARQYLHVIGLQQYINVAHIQKSSASSPRLACLCFATLYPHAVENVSVDRSPPGGGCYPARDYPAPRQERTRTRTRTRAWA